MHSCEHFLEHTFVCNGCGINYFCGEECFAEHQQECEARITQDVMDRSLTNMNAENIMHLHGPVSIYMFKVGDVQWILFGDKHTETQIPIYPNEMRVEYNQKEDKIEFKGESGYEWEIGRLLFSIFSRAHEEFRHVDFFLEYPFFRDPSKKHSHDAGSNYIYKLFMLFQDCFYSPWFPKKTECAFGGVVKMHYIDYRQSIQGEAAGVLPGLALFYMFDALNKISPQYLILAYRKLESLGFATLMDQTHEILIYNDDAKQTLADMWIQPLSEFTKWLYGNPQIAEHLMEHVKSALSFIRSLPSGPSEIAIELAKWDDPVLKPRVLEFFSVNPSKKWPMRYQPYVAVNWDADTQTIYDTIVLQNMKNMLGNASMLMDLYGIARVMRQKSSKLRIGFMGNNHVLRWLSVFEYRIMPRGAPILKLPEENMSKDKTLTPEMREVFKQYLE
jgi:hypothetical protein